MTPFSVRMTLAGAVMISALVAGSDQITVRSLAPVPAATPGAAAPAPTPVTCSLSLAAIFSESAYLR